MNKETNMNVSILQKILVYKMWDFTRRVVWLWRISGGYLQEMMGVVIRSKKPSKHIQNCPSMTDECQYTFAT